MHAVVGASQQESAEDVDEQMNPDIHAGDSITVSMKDINELFGAVVRVAL